jgi:hypothetical protein
MKAGRKEEKVIIILFSYFMLSHLRIRSESENEEMCLSASAMLTKMFIR